ncbi:MAG: hypothetical protein K2X35_19060 [Bryobacteraceae bacterium]|nr:hypothetical protein [Bryobacteraceae bacterium]
MTIKTSTIFVSVGDRTEVYRSVDQVPPPLRRKLEMSTHSLNSATILIADRNGREELTRSLRGLPSPIRTRLAASLGVSSEEAGAGLPKWPALRGLARHWAELVFPGAIAVLIWLAVSQY